MSGGLPKLPAITPGSSEKVFRHKSLTQGGIVPDGTEPIDNERLSLLGNSVLHACVTKYLFTRFKLKKVGYISSVRSALTGKEKIRSWCRAYGLQKRLEHSPFLAIDNLVSAHIDVFQAYLGAAAIDSDTGMEAVDIFISALLDTEPESAFELNGPGTNGASSSVGAASSSIVTQAYHTSMPTSFVSTPRELTGSPSPPQYDLGVRKPLGAAEDSGEFKTEDENGDGTTSSSNGDGKGWDSNASSMVMRPPQHIVPSPPPVIPAASPVFAASIPAASPASFVPASSSPFVQRTTKIGADLASMQKKALAQFNEICAKRGERPDWDFTATGPAHSRQWEARLLLKGREISSGAAKGKQDAKNEAAYKALLALNWPLPD